jgi:uncharacterized protein (TIRG00374 family)
MFRKKRFWLGIGLSVAVSGFLLYLVMRDIQWDEALDAIGRLRFDYVLIAFAMITLGLGARGLRWHYIHCGQLPLKRSFNLTSVAFFVNNLLPFRAGDLVRVEGAAHGNPRIPRSTGLSLVVVERLLDFLALVVLIALTLTGLTTVPPDIQSVMGFITIASILASIGLVLMVTVFQNLTRNIVIWLSERISILKKFNVVRILDNVLLGFAMIRRPKFFALVMFWNVMAWACLVVAYYFLMTALFPDATWAEATLFVVAAALAIIIPTTIASVGAIEGSAILAMTSQGYPSESGFALGLTLHLITLLSYTLPGLYGIWAETLTVSGILEQVADGHIDETQETQATEPIDEG